MTVKKSFCKRRGQKNLKFKLAFSFPLLFGELGVGVEGGDSLLK